MPCPALLTLTGCCCLLTGGSCYLRCVLLGTSCFLLAVCSVLLTVRHLLLAGIAYTDEVVYMNSPRSAVRAPILASNASQRQSRRGQASHCTQGVRGTLPPYQHPKIGTTLLGCGAPTSLLASAIPLPLRLLSALDFYCMCIPSRRTRHHMCAVQTFRAR